MFLSRLVYVSKDSQDKDTMTFRGEEKTASGAIMSKLFIIREGSNNLITAINDRLSNEKLKSKNGECWHLIAMVEPYILPARRQDLMEPGDRLVDFVYTGEGDPELLYRGFIHHEEYSKYTVILYQ